MKRFSQTVICALLASASSAANTQAAPAPVTAPKPQAVKPAPAQPKLIVAISIDQFSSDLFNEYRTTFRGGLKRLSQGVVFPAGYQSHAATETCPGHSTILTGSRPARTGIIANSWFMPKMARSGKDGKPEYAVYCAEDPNEKGSSSTNYLASPFFLNVPTLGDRLKEINAASRVISVAGKDRAAIMMGGEKADKTLWWGSKGFESYKGVDLSADVSIKSINALAMAQIATPRKPLLPVHCASRHKDIALSPTVSIGTVTKAKPGDARAFRGTTSFDSLTVDLAIQQFKSAKLGQGEGVDVLALGLSGTDYVGHGTGTAGGEMCAQIDAVDVHLGRLFAALDLSAVPYAVVLTADHGGLDVPERSRIQGLPAAQRVDKDLLPSFIGGKLAMRFGQTQNALLGDGPFGDIYVSPAMPDERRAEILAAAISMYRDHPQVAAVFTKEELIAAPAPSGPPEDWSLRDRYKASFNAERSGDFVVALKPYITPIPNTSSGYYATHGSPWGYDRKVPILFWWRGITPFEQPGGIETADILPTLASLINLNIPSEEIDGRCIDIIQGAASNCQ